LQFSCQRVTIPPAPPTRDTVIGHRYDDADIIPDAPGGWAGTPSAGGASEWLSYVSGLLHPPELDFPVGGDFYTAVDWTGAIIPELVSGTPTATIIGVPKDVDRRDTPSDEEQLLNVVVDINGEVVDTESPFYVPGITQAGIRYMEGQATTVPATDEGEDMGWYTDIDEEWFGGMLPGGAQPTFPGWGGGATPGFGGPGQPNIPSPTIPPNGNGGGGGVTPVPGLGNACFTEDPYKGCVYKRVCGVWKWVKQKRRRRKQLFTPRDAAQMSSLMGSLPAGAAGVSIAKTWIAAHPS